MLQLFKVQNLLMVIGILLVGISFSQAQGVDADKKQELESIIASGTWKLEGENVSNIKVGTTDDNKLLTIKIKYANGSKKVWQVTSISNNSIGIKDGNISKVLEKN